MSTSTSTSTTASTHTITQTATYLADTIMGSISEILSTLGIDAARLFDDWEQDEKAITAWIKERSLKQVRLQCRRPDGAIKPIFIFPVTYSSDGRAQEAFVNSKAAFARYQAKLATVPKGTTYSLFCTFNGPHSTQDGWYPGKAASTDGLTQRSFGSLADAPHARVSMDVYN